MIEKTSDTVFIIGGGDSTGQIIPDGSILDGKDVIVCNKSFQKVPSAKICLFADQRWFLQYVNELKSFKGKLMACTTQYQKELFKFDMINHIFSRGTGKGLCTNLNQNRLNGSNVGHMAINLAFLLGYKKIILIGFDMDDTAKKIHWHDEPPWGTNTAQYNKTFLPEMDTVPPYQELHDFKIYNLNPNSKVRCFDFAKLEDFL